MQDQGRRLAGRYELAEIIGRGGMGTVYRATDTVLDRSVAVKLLPAELAEGDPRHVARFKREARATASLAHRGVVAVYDTGEDEATRFIVMEFVTGRSLSEVLREDAPLEPGAAAGIAAQIAGALGAAHAAGIVHRDIKPGNVMVDDDGAVKVLDFGIARALDGATLTQASAVLGTAGYIPPEQALGERADERSDIYSLGCVLYALLTGRAPFTADAPAAVLHQHVNRDPRPPSALNRAVPPELDAIVMQMLAKSPAERPQSASEVAERLSGVPASSPRMAAAPPRGQRTAPMEKTARTQVLGAGAVTSRRRRAIAAAALAGAVGVIAALVALASGGGSRRPPAGAQSASAATATGPSTASKKAPNAAASQRPATAQTASTPASAQTPPTTFAAAANAVSSLLSQAIGAGTIDPHAAQQISNGLAAIVGAHDAGEPQDAQQRLADLSQKLATLQEKGRIAPAAAGTLGTALASLGATLPATTQGQGASAEAQAAAAEHDARPGGGNAKHGRGHGDGGD